MCMTIFLRKYKVIIYKIFVHFIQVLNDEFVLTRKFCSLFKISPLCDIWNLSRRCLISCYILICPLAVYLVSSLLNFVAKVTERFKRFNKTFTCSTLSLRSLINVQYLIVKGDKLSEMNHQILFDILSHLDSKGLKININYWSPNFVMKNSPT